MKIINIDSDRDNIREQALENIKNSKKFVAIYLDENRTWKYACYKANQEQLIYILEMAKHEILSQEWE